MIASPPRGPEARFAEHRQRLPCAAELGRPREAETWLSEVKKLAGLFEAPSVVPGPAWDEAASRVARLYRNPGDWLTFTHGDLAPSNIFAAGAEVRLRGARPSRA